MKWVIILALIVASSASPLKEDAKEKEEAKKQDVELAKKGSVDAPKPEKAEEQHKIMKRSCDLDDYNKLQAKVIAALEKRIEKLLAREKRDASSSAGASSETSADGKSKSTAFAKSSNTAAKEPEVKGAAPPTPASLTVPILHPAEAHPPAPHSELPPPPATTEGSLPPPPPPSGEPAHPTPAEGAGNTVQNVQASASMDKGTAVVKAVAKRAAVVQNLAGSGNKAVVTGESHKGAETNVQKLEATGGEMGIATAVVDKQNATMDHKTGKPGSPDLTIQNVKASGNKAVAGAISNKGSGSTTSQEATAEGGEFASASVSASKRDVSAQLVEDGVGGSIMSVDTPTTHAETTSMSKRAVAIVENVRDGSAFIADAPGKLAIVKSRPTRELCSPIKMDDNIRLLIRTTVEQVFAEIKKEALSP